ncbi:MAG: hypothetical protein LUG94_03910 [Ruminococcus sp.]|nr:hypothetical protein [Ruminococcus sp.]
MAIPNMNNRGRNGYINNRNIRQHNSYNYGMPNRLAIEPQTSYNHVNQDIPNDIPKDIPKEPSHNDSFPNNRFIGNPISSILDIFNSKNGSLDKDKIIILILIYLLYKEDKKKVNLKLLLALGYILL